MTTVFLTMYLKELTVVFIISTLNFDMRACFKDIEFGLQHVKPFGTCTLCLLCIYSNMYHTRFKDDPQLHHTNVDVRNFFFSI